jgi:CRP-like cAMP-binding protein
MISPEVLRRYPFFGFLDENGLKAVAMIADEVSFKDGEEILTVRQKAEFLYFMVSGNGSNYFIVDEREGYKKLYAGEINPGEIFGVSALIKPYIYTTSIFANGEVKALKINAKALRTAFEMDAKMGFEFMTAVAQALMTRLNDARAQIASPD